MGFEPQTADQPLVNVQKRTTKVNIAVAIGVVLFLIIGLAYSVWAYNRHGPDQQPAGSSVPAK